MAPSAVPWPPVASAPVLQWVSGRVQLAPKVPAACVAIARQRSTSSRWMARARSARSAGSGASACSSAIAHARLTAVGLEARSTCRRGVEILAASCSQRVPHGGRDADRGSAADGEGRDRLGHVAGRPALEPGRLLGQPPLVEQDDPIRLEPDDLLWAQVSLCG